VPPAAVSFHGLFHAMRYDAHRRKQEMSQPLPRRRPPPPSPGEPTPRQQAAELIKHRKGALRRYQMRERLRHDTIPADPVMTKLCQSLQLAAWAKANSPDRDEAFEFERQCFDYLLRWLGELERPDDDASLDLLLGERKERRSRCA
jgi:hypothetical protein